MNFTTKTCLSALAAYGALQLSRRVVRSRRRFEWKGARVVIVGASRGLGLVLSRKLASLGARLAICSRNIADLEAARIELYELGTEVLAIPCDAREQSSMDSFIDQVIADYGGVDVLLNVAGLMEVGPYESMTKSDFEESMRTNCWIAYNSMFAALPSMRQQRWGRIVNVASIGGKVAVPHMLPYAMSKFALVGLSNGLRAELAKENVFVTTACPGMIRTGSPRNATFKGQHRKEYAWFIVADSLPILSLDAESAADQILSACQLGQGEVVITHPLNLLMKCQYLLPELTSEFIALADRYLPSMGGIGTRAAMGYESESVVSHSPLTLLTQQAATEKQSKIARHSDGMSIALERLKHSEGFTRQRRTG